MTTTITWSIAQLERHTADGIVYTAHCTVDANDGTYSAADAEEFTEALAVGLLDDIYSLS